MGSRAHRRVDLAEDYQRWGAHLGRRVGLAKAMGEAVDSAEDW